VLFHLPLPRLSGAPNKEKRFRARCCNTSDRICGTIVVTIYPEIVIAIRRSPAARAARRLLDGERSTIVSFHRRLINSRDIRRWLTAWRSINRHGNESSNGSISDERHRRLTRLSRAFSFIRKRVIPSSGTLGTRDSSMDPKTRRAFLD